MNRRHNKLALAEAALADFGPDHRIWSHENAPFRNEEDKLVIGTRYYYILTPEEVYHRIKSTPPIARNEYEVIYGSCHLFADYDLKRRPDKSIQKAHETFVQYASVLLQDIGTLRENILTAHTAKKESMHIRWDIVSPDGSLCMFASPETCRQFVSTVIRNTVSDLGFVDNPLFFQESEGVYCCILDDLVYNTNRNFRMGDCVKPKEKSEDVDGWLTDPTLVRMNNNNNNNNPTLSLSDFLRHLVTYIPPGSRTSIIDVSAWPDQMDALRNEAGTRSKPPKAPTSGTDKKYARLETALDAVPGPEYRVWSHEYTPFRNDENRLIQGTRCYYILTAEDVYRRIASAPPVERNEHEVLYGPCHLFADYDLERRLGKSIQHAHETFVQYASALLRGVGTLRENILTAHTAKKESMHVRWDIISSSDGSLCVFEYPEACRQFVSAAIKASVEELGFANNPLFFHESEKVYRCILDEGVYASNRTFRMGDCVKPKENLADVDGWLTDPTIPQKRDSPLAPALGMADFLRHLVCYIPPNTKTSFIDVSKWPDYMDLLRYEAGVGSKPGPPGYPKPPAPRNTSSSSTTSGLSGSLGAVVDYIINAIQHKYPAAKLVLKDNRIMESGFFTLRMDGSKYCEIKQADHKTVGCIYFVAHIDFPKPRVVQKCYKTQCRDKTFQVNLTELINEQEYEKMCLKVLEDKVIKNKTDLF